jgi:hypothetical protein
MFPPPFGCALAPRFAAGRCLSSECAGRAFLVGCSESGSSRTQSAATTNNTESRGRITTGKVLVAADVATTCCAVTFLGFTWVRIQKLPGCAFGAVKNLPQPIHGHAWARRLP